MSLVVVVAAGCGAAVEEAPIAMPMWVERGAVRERLAEQGYCGKSGPVRRVESYERCKSPGLQPADSWVVVEYDREGRVQALRRFERYASEGEATERWQTLVEARRRRHGHDSAEARTAISDAGKVPPGTASWLSWMREDGQVLESVYLVRPESAKDASVIEEIIVAPLPRL